MLYRSAYTSEVVYGNKSQQQSGVAQLVPNQKGARSSTVGMSMAPSIWIVNFAAVYTLNPKLAAYMPARWTPIPTNVVQATQGEPHRPGSVQQVRVVIPRRLIAGAPGRTARLSAPSVSAAPL